MRIIIVSGMHRSGTSCVAGELASAGFGVSTDLIPADSANAKGYFEDRQLIALHDEILLRFGSNWMDPAPLRQIANLSELSAEYAERLDACLNAMNPDGTTVVVKDPRICRLWPQVLAAATAKGHTLYNIHVVRSCAEVASSLWKRNNLPAPHAFQLWARYNMDTMDSARDIASVTVSYRHVVQDKTVLPQALEKLGLVAPMPENFGTFASGELMHGIDDQDDAPYRRDDFLLPVFEKETEFTHDNMRALYDQCGGDLAAKERRHYSFIHSTLWTVIEEKRAAEVRFESLQAKTLSLEGEIEAAKGEIEAAQAEILALSAHNKALQGGIAGHVAAFIRYVGRRLKR